MTELFETFINDPTKGVALGAITLVVYFIIRFERRLSSRFEAFEKSLGEWESKIREHSLSTKLALETHANETRKAFEKHGLNLIKIVETINNDMQKVQNSSAEMKTSVILKADELKETVAHVARETKTMMHVYELATEKFEHKFGSIIELKTQSTDAIGRLTKVETDSAQFKVSVDTRFQSTGRLFKAVREELAAIKKKSEGGDK